MSAENRAALRAALKEALTGVKKNARTMRAKAQLSEGDDEDGTTRLGDGKGDRDADRAGGKDDPAADRKAGKKGPEGAGGGDEKSSLKEAAIEFFTKSKRPYVGKAKSMAVDPRGQNQASPPSSGKPLMKGKAKK